jgi:hypothetical protein
MHSPMLLKVRQKRDRQGLDHLTAAQQQRFDMTVHDDLGVGWQWSAGSHWVL